MDEICNCLAVRSINLRKIFSNNYIKYTRCSKKKFIKKIRKSESEGLLTHFI